MSNKKIKYWLDYSYLSDINQSYLESIYEDFLTDPNLINSDWRNIFQNLSSIKNYKEEKHSKIKEYFLFLAKNNKKNYKNTICFRNKKISYDNEKILQLINAFRFHGHKIAKLDPLNMCKKRKIEELSLKFYNFYESNFHYSYINKNLFSDQKKMKLEDLHKKLKKIYCRYIGFEYMHIDNLQERRWIEKRIELTDIASYFTKVKKKEFLKELIHSEEIEKYLGEKFPGSKRFSLEGCDVLNLMLKEIIHRSQYNNINEILLGMTHRGRLNALINVFNKDPNILLKEFQKEYRQKLGSGDVKYHQGFFSSIKNKNGYIYLHLYPNPSHLEIVSPVVMGATRAKIDYSDNKYEKNKKIISITLHGDAAFIGQGVVQETLNMSSVPAYNIGGTIRIVINNQIGFTTSNPIFARSSFYCTDIAKMNQIPIFHVNADDPESVAFVSHMALDFRNKFNHDVIIDLVCYRRNGHNESDDPNVTQPLMYKKIKNHCTAKIIYFNRIEREGIITKSENEKIRSLFRDYLIKGSFKIKNKNTKDLDNFSYKENSDNKCIENSYKKINVEKLKNIATKISTIPSNIKLHPLVKKIYNDRKEMALGRKFFNWGEAELLSYATILNQGVSIRLSGEDSARGTFFHRHAIVYDQENGNEYIPLKNLHENQGKFFIWDSVLSEEAVLAFEYGYSTNNLQNLVIWEAQFGDFSNGAQIVIDQFISSGEQKWGKTSGLVLLLPHGYEGQGPEHSSARLERYLQLCAEKNIQVCVPSTAGQIYHIIRRQAFSKIKKPLIIMSPKSLLRHPLAASSIEELSKKSFQPVIGEIDIINAKIVNRVIICSGKIYYDLLNKRRSNKQKNVVIIRLEQLYPFPEKEILKVLSLYKDVKNFIWCQEEPKNQGAWKFIQHYLQKVLFINSTLDYIGRTSSASPAVGYLSLHKEQQENIINTALKI